MKKTGLIALGIVAALVVVVAAAQLRDGSSESSVTPENIPLPGEAATDLTVELGEREVAPEAGAAADPLTTSESYSDDGDEVALPLPEMAGHKIIRNANISLGVEDVAAAVQQVETIADSAGGFVSESSVFVDSPQEPVEALLSEEKSSVWKLVGVRVDEILGLKGP